jgi:hypothetical protein
MSDFLTKVQEVEQQAATLIEKAVARKQTVIRKYRTELMEEQELKNNETKDKMKESVLVARAEARNNYDMQIKAGEVDAKKLEVERGGRANALQSEATTFLLEILS